MNDDLRSAIIATAGRIGADPVDLATTISYETGRHVRPVERPARRRNGVSIAV